MTPRSRAPGRPLFPEGDKILSAHEKEHLLMLLRSEESGPIDGHLKKSLASILEAYFALEDRGNKAGRPPRSWAQINRRTYQMMALSNLVFEEMSAGKSYAEATKIIAKRRDVSHSSLKKHLEQFAKAMGGPFFRKKSKHRPAS